MREFDYYYDQVVCVGELLSTAIVSHYLNEIGVGNNWIDVRDIIRTDDNFRDAIIDWDYTSDKVRNEVLPAFESHDIVLTQGYIGCKVPYGHCSSLRASSAVGRLRWVIVVKGKTLNRERQNNWFKNITLSKNKF